MNGIKNYVSDGTYPGNLIKLSDLMYLRQVLTPAVDFFRLFEPFGERGGSLVPLRVDAAQAADRLCDLGITKIIDRPHAADPGAQIRIDP